MKAYPCNPALNEQWQGMELRDYFAATNNIDDMTLYHLTDIDLDDLTVEERIMALAVFKYKFADAMMKARTK